MTTGITQFERVTKDMRDQLRAPLPAEAIKPHPTKTYLSTIKPIYVTERLNDVFGIGTWQLRSELIEKVGNGTVITKTTLTIPTFGIHYESFGGNDNGGEGSKGFDLGDAYKGSVTDSITKICSYMEIGIDVFKGKGNLPQKTDSPKPEAKKDPVKKSWLNPNTKEWTDAVERIKNGTPLDQVESFFLISKANKSKLETESKAV